MSSFFKALGAAALSFIKYVGKDAVDTAIAALASEKDAILAAVNALAVKDAPSVAAVILKAVEAKIPPYLQPFINGVLQAEVGKLVADVPADDAAWFDELVAKIQAWATAAGL